MSRTRKKSHDLDILFYNSAAGTADSSESVLHQVEQYFQMVWSDSHSKTWLESAPFFLSKERTSGDRSPPYAAQHMEGGSSEL